MNYIITKSIRKTLSIHINPDGTILVKAPLFVSQSRINTFVEAKKDWIEKCQKRIQKQGPKKIYTQEEVKKMKSDLLEYIKPRLHNIWSEHHLPKYTSIKITKSERRWGSCSAKNGLCFSYRLAQYLPSTLSFSEEPALNLFQGESLSENRRDTPTEYDKNTRFIDAIIVHELAHLLEKNHQKPFWNLVYSMMPNYESIIKSQRDVE